MVKNTLAKIVLTLGLPLFLAVNCPDDTTMKMKTERDKEAIMENLESRYEVIRVEVFRDDLAYNEKRGIYEIIDHKTGTCYLGISGIGITEVGSHSNGETTEEDER